MNVAQYPLNNASTGELLTRLMEECSEVIKATAKVKRFGPLGANPDTGLLNRVELSNEIGDVMLVVAELRMRGVVMA